MGHRSVRQNERERAHAEPQRSQLIEELAHRHAPIPRRKRGASAVLRAAAREPSLGQGEAPASVRFLRSETYIQTKGAAELNSQGDETFREMTPLCASSARTHAGHSIERAKKAGAKGWLIKPVKPEILQAAVKTATS